MKRHAWLSLGIGLSLFAVGCDDGNSNEERGNVDGGLSPEDLSNEIKNLQDEINKLGMEQGALDGRIVVLETPKTPGSCSAGELCIPDGIDLSKQGLQPVIAALCAHETNCCSPGELNLVYGPAIKNAADCEATFTDMVNNGLVYSENMLSPFLQLVIRVAHGLNDTKVGVKVNPEGVAACAAVIQQASCPGDEESESGCSPSEDYPCSLELMLTGTEREGDTCDPYTEVPECGPGLTCREIDESNAVQPGICAPLAAVGDRCTDEGDCDKLFCDFATGTCQARAKEGEACAYVDPTFVYVTPYDGSPTGNGSSTKLDCERGLSCNPLTNTCVKSSCATGAFCSSNSQCPTGNVCSRPDTDAFDAFQEQYYWTFVGLCSVPVADGGACVVHGVENDCASKACVGNVCLGSDGSACDAPADCASNHCGTDGKCSPVCDIVGLTEAEEPRTCADGYYCNYYSGSVGRCEPKVASGACGSASLPPANRDASCQSGYCNGTNCAPKAAAGGACTAGQHSQCPSGQFCRVTTCTNLPAAGTACSTDDECGPAGAHDCYDVDGSLSGTVSQCFPYEYGQAHSLTNGVYCSGSDQCQSQWCRSNGVTSLCTARRAENEACDISGTATAAPCDDGLYCATADANAATGTCKKRGLTGEACDERYEDQDCLGSDCMLHNERFLCGPSSMPEDQIFCAYY